LKGVVSDPDFANADSLKLEVLETGESAYFQFQDAFELRLPKDTLWAICLSSNEQEKCYEIKYTGQDSTFNFNLSGETNIIYSQVLDSGAVTIERSAQSDSKDTTQVDVEALLSQSNESTTKLKKIVLQLRKRPKTQLGKSIVSAKKIQRMPGLAEADVIRSIQALPGVVASSDFSTKIYVRGGGADQNLFLLDNGVVYSPVHFFGLFSTFLVEGIDEVEFYKGGFAPRYGNRLSSVVSIKSREGGNDTTDTWFQGSSIKISTFATQVHTEGRQSDFSWLLAYRTTYISQVLEWLNEADLIDFELDYVFTDVQGHLRYDMGERHRLGFTFYGGRDELKFGPIGLDWGNRLYALNYNYPLGDKWDAHSMVAYTNFDQSFGLDGLFSVYNDIQDNNIFQQFHYLGKKNHKPSFGVDFKRMAINFTNDQEAAQIKFIDVQKFWLLAGFAQDIWTVGKTEYTYGARINYSEAADHFGIEPRLSVEHKFKNNQKVQGHVGRYEQYINSIIWGDFETINEFYYPSTQGRLKKVPPSSSLLFSLGYIKEKLWGDFIWGSEVYYKTQNDLLIWAPEESEGFDGSANVMLADFFKGAEGYSMGYELSLKTEEGRIFGGVNFSQGYSVILEENNPIAYFPDWHQPYSLKGDLAVNWRGEDGFWGRSPKNKYFRSSMAIKWASGLPFTEYIGYHPTHDLNQSVGGDAGGPVPEFENNVAVRQGNRNASFVPDYFRFDVKAIDWGRKDKWNFSWTFLNVTDHVNVFLYNYDTSQNPPQEDVISQFPFFPILMSYEYRF
jgi:hypothetical protein